MTELEFTLRSNRIEQMISGLREQQATHILAHITGEHECFSIEDMMEITGESREEVLKQVEDMRAAALAAGENPDDYAVPVERKILYFPDGFTS